MALKGLYLSLFMGPMVPMPAPKSVVDALISAQVNTGGERSGFQLVFSMNKTSPIRQTLMPAGFMDTGTTRVILVATVGGIPYTIIDGIVTRQEVNASNDAGQSTVTLTGEDLTVLMDVIQFPMMRYPGMPILARVNLIVAKYAMFGIAPVVIPPLFDDVPIPTDKIPSQNGSDLAYIKKLASDCGYIYYLQPITPGTSIFYFGPDIRIPVPQPALSVNMDANTNVESLSFSLDGMAKKIVIMTILDPITKKIPIPIPVPNISLLRPPLGARLTAPMKIEYPPDGGNKSSIEAIALALAKTSETSDAITATGTLNVLRYGQVLNAFQTVGVRGAGLAYDGLYYVRTVSHSIKRGEYKQSFTLSRDGLVSQTPVVPS